jgi:hypothetical protein
VYAVFWQGDLREEDHLKDSGIYEIIILKWIFKKRDVGWGGRTGSIWLSTGTVGLL